MKGQEVTAPFLTDLDSAKQIAIAKEVPILMVFAGSDWCRPCMQFKVQILLDTAFQQYADSQLVILYLDFPVKKKNRLEQAQLQHNEVLAERFNKKGAFPHIVVLTPQAEVLGVLVYRQQPVTVFWEEFSRISSLN